MHPNLNPRNDEAKCYPYPSELLAVLSCEAVPLAWRELHALAAYTCARPGELRVLEWPDVDLADQQIRITKAWDFDAEEVKSTKTHETRTLPIEPTLLPLLRTMHERGGAGAWSFPRSRPPATTSSPSSCGDTSSSPAATARPSP